VGFGVVFGSMIVFTLLYAAEFINHRLDRALGLLIGVHICVQAIYTCGIHAAALRDSSPRANRNGLSLWLWVIAAVVIALVSRWLERQDVHIGPLALGEVAYRSFMSFYGLFAPAYVWLCVHPGRGFVRPHRSEVRMTVLACVLAVPFFWIGFMFGPIAWVLPGVAIIVGARFALDYSRRDLLAEQRAAMLTQGDRR
jgi:hypothetical protein